VETRPNVWDLRLDGGHPALDFVNSVGGPRAADPDPDTDALHGYGDLLEWSQRTGLLDGGAAERLARRARRHPAEARRAFAAALELRSLVDRIFRAVAEGDRPAEADLADLRDAASRALQRGRLVPQRGGFNWSWAEASALEAPLWPLAHAAVELLTDGPLDRLRCCDQCRWLFLDESRNRSRRWCSMEECGTAVKKRRYIERRRARRGRARASK
jgi:predicted RNA-binding Zn ribbon-like protein